MNVHDLAALITERKQTTPYLVALGGGVAVGKSVLAAALAEELPDTTVICTDCFLFSNSTLSERGALMRKGYPDTFDDDALVATVQALKAGAAATVPVYSHHTYDIVDGEERTVEPADVVIVEGVNVLQPALAPHFDLRIYLDAAEEHVKAWYVARFLQLHDLGRRNGGFYAMFATMPEAEVTQLAEATWDAVNGPNLRRHIAPTKANADVVVTKGPDHAIVEVSTPSGRSSPS